MRPEHVPRLLVEARASTHTAALKVATPAWAPTQLPRGQVGRCSCIWPTVEFSGMAQGIYNLI